VPSVDYILNMPGFTIKQVSGYQPLRLDVVYRRVPRCGHCESKCVRKKASFMREVHHETVGHRRIILRFKAYKLYCHDCRRYSNQRFPGIGKYQRATDRLHAQVFFEHTDGISQKRLSERFKVGKSTIERWYHRRYSLADKELSSSQIPTVLGIDEHFFSRKQGYATTLCDLRNHKVFDIVKGKSESSLSNYFANIPDKSRVKVICMDLCSSYRSIVKRHFPHAKIVADRFHVIRLLHHQCMATYRQLDTDIKHNRGLLGALRKKPERLTDKQRKRRDDYLLQHPAIATVYHFKQQLYDLLMKKMLTRRRCQPLIPVLLDMIKQLKQSPFKSLRTLGKTLYNWREEIVCMWRFTKNNGITEGFHRKMKLIQRRAYGFKNFENYRMRVRVLCC